MAASGIPKVMNITPQFIGVNEYVKDARRVGDAAQQMSARVKSAINGINSSSASISGTATNIRGLNTAFTTGVSSINRWAAGFNASNNIITRFGSTLFSLGRHVSRVSYQIERAGRGLFLAFTLPFIALSVGVVKAARDFETALVKVENLVGVNRNIVQAWGRDILKVAKDLATTPVEMADGLFAAASGFGELAGVSPTMEVLVASTKAARLGLGEIDEVARAATAQLNAFGKENLTAEQSVSLLILGVREGNLEIDKLASAIGNVLGIASTMGAGADDVLAFVSAYTRFGVAPTRAVTALNAALSNLLKPSAKAREILEAYGYTLDEIKEKLAGPAGLANLFVEMRNTMAEEDFYEIFGVRGLRGVLAVTGTEWNDFTDEYLRIAKTMQSETESIFDTMAEGAEVGTSAWKRFSKEAIIEHNQFISALSAGWQKYTETLDYWIERIKSQIQSIFLGVDAAIRPFLKDAAEAISGYLEQIENFIRENKETTKLILKMAAGFALLGPAAMIAGRALQFVALGIEGVGTFAAILGRSIGFVLNFTVAAFRMGLIISTTVVSALMSLGHYAFLAGSTITNLLIGAFVGLGRSLIFVGTTAARTATVSLASLATTITSGLVSAITSAAAGLASLIPLLVGSASAIAVVGTAVLGGIGLIAAFGDGIKEAVSDVETSVNTVSDEISTYFTDLIPEGESWGSGLMQAFSDGIIDGIIYVVNSLNQLGQWIADFLAPASPPKILPHIDQWGKQTMQEWIDGWKQADFDVFKDIFSNIETFLRATIKDDEEGIIPRLLLGSRQYIAEAVNQIRELGRVSRETLQNLYSSLGSTTMELREYIEASLAATKAAKDLAEAQERINKINERYNALLKPIQERLAEINRQGEKLGYEREMDSLRRIISNQDTPDRVRQMAQLRLEEITLEIKSGELEAERDRELSIAEKQLKAAQNANDAAQERLAFAREALGLQMKGYDLLAELNKTTKDIADKLDKLPKKLKEAFQKGEAPDFQLGGGGVPLPDPDAWKDALGEDGPLGEVDKKLNDLKESAQNLLTTWQEVWDNMKLKVVGWRTAALTSFQSFKTKFVEKWGPTLETLKEEGVRTFNNLKRVFNNFWTNTSESRTNIITWFGEFSDWLSDKAPGAITTFSDFINDTLIKGGLEPLSKYLSGEEQIDWDAILGPPENDPIQNWIDTWPIEENAEKIKEKLRSIWDLVMSSLDVNVDENLPPLPSGGGTPTADLFPELQTAISEFATSVEENLQPAKDAWNNYFDQKQSWVESEGLLDSNLKKLREFFTGVEEETDKGVESVDKYGVGLGIGIDTTTLFSDTIKELIPWITQKKDELIKLKDEALIKVQNQTDILKQKIEWLRLKMQEWKTKVEEVREWLIKLATSVRVTLMNALRTLGNYLTNTINSALEALSGFLTTIRDTIKQGLASGLERLNRAFENMVTFVSNLLEPIRKAVESLERLWELIQKVRNTSLPSLPSSREEESSSTTDVNDSFIPDYGLPTQQGYSVPQISSPVTPIPTIASPMSAIATGDHGVAINFGQVIINNGMDLEMFKATVRDTVIASLA